MKGVTALSCSLLRQFLLDITECKGTKDGRTSLFMHGCMYDKRFPMEKMLSRLNVQLD